MRLIDADEYKKRISHYPTIKAIAFKELRYVKTVDAEIVRHGMWINISISAHGESLAECDLCGAVVHNNFSSIINYCPNCGAKMDVTR